MQWKARFTKFWLEWMRPLLVTAAVLGSFRSAVADWNDVPTGSMKPTILEGDRIFVYKAAYDLRIPFTTWRLVEWAVPERGDIAVFFSPADGKRLVKRVVGVPGDRIEVREGTLLINGGPAEYRSLEDEVIEQLHREEHDGYRFASETLGGREHPVMMASWGPSLGRFGPVEVPQGHFFMMGDNRDNSVDSRWFGFVSRDRIVGRATRVVASLDPDQHYRPRWGRFFSALP
jgi:signal peptidase I